jgi:hypothetical protein
VRCSYAPVSAERADPAVTKELRPQVGPTRFESLRGRMPLDMFDTIRTDHRQHVWLSGKDLAAQKLMLF